MAKRRYSGRAVTGILLLDKPLGVTSNHALQRVKRLFQANKAGHTGSLDPLATGLLPICLGHATKFSAFLLDADKYYQVQVRLGVTTTTADAEGEQLTTAPLDGVNETAVRAALTQFTGAIAQLPPMYSAVKYQGERLYKLARAGQEVERTPRTIHIYRLELLSYALPTIELAVHCSKGTYVRTLAEDIGRVLGCGGHVAALRRTGVGPYLESGTPTPTTFITMPTLETLIEQQDGPARYQSLDALLLPLDSALGHCPAVKLSADAAFYVRQGQSVLIPQAPTEGLVRLYDAGGQFCGVGDVLDDGKIQPRRLL